MRRRNVILLPLIAGLVLAVSASVKGPPVGPGGQGLVVGMGSDIGRRGASAGWEEKTYIFVYAGYDTLTHNDPEFAAAIANADSIVLLDGAPAEFAHIMIDRAQPDAAISQIQSGSYLFRSYNNDTGDAADYYDITSGANTANDNCRRVSLVHFAVEEYIPAKSPIVSAYIHLGLNGDLTTSVQDSTYVVLMTIETDDEWWQTVGLTTPALYNVSHACFNRQVNTQPSGFWGYATSYPDSSYWIPSIENRPRFYDWGAVADARGYTTSPITAGSWITQPFKNCVQAAVNGEVVNNGFAMIHIAPTTTLRRMRFYGWEPVDQAVDNQAWAEVTFLSGRSYRAPLPNNAEVAFSLTLDGMQKDIHEIAARQYRAHGGQFMTGMRGKWMAGTWPPVDPGPPAKVFIPLLDSLVGWYDEGLCEIAYHTYDGAAHAGGLYDTGWPASNDPLDLTVEYTRGMYPLTLTGAATGMDQTLYDLDPDVMFTEFEAFTGYSWVGKPKFCRMLIHAGSDWRVPSMRAIPWMGYIGFRAPIRDIEGYDNDGHLDVYRSPIYAGADSLRANIRPQNALGPQNLTQLAMSHQLEVDFVGDSTTDLGYAEVYYRSRMAFEKARAQNRRLVTVFIHSSKTNPAYGTGFAEYEMDACLDALADTYGGKALALGDIVFYYRAFSTPVATPAGFAQSDTAKYTVEDGVYRQLDGVDGAFIPGAKQ